MNRNTNNESVWTPVKYGIIVLAAVSGFSIMASGLGLLTLPFTSGIKIIEKTLDSDNIINNYEWFKQQYADVQAIDKKIVAAETAVASFKAEAGDRSTWTFEDKQESSRLGSVLLGLQNQRASMVAEYNARSQMANRNLFKTNDLPETLN